MKENEQNENELNEEDLEQVQGGLMKKPLIIDNPPTKEKPAVNPIEAKEPNVKFF